MCEGSPVSSAYEETSDDPGETTETKSIILSCDDSQPGLINMLNIIRDETVMIIKLCYDNYDN